MVPRNVRLLLALTALTAVMLACAGGMELAGEAPFTMEAEEPAAAPEMEAETPAPATVPGEPDQLVEEEPTPAPATPLPAIPERRRIVLEWPEAIRAGDSDVIRLSLEMDRDGTLTPTALIEGNVVRSEGVEVPNLYETHNVVAEARLDIAGVEYTPVGTVQQPLMAGQSVDFFWSLNPEKVGEYRGTVWLFLRFIPRDGGPERERALSAQIVEVRVVNLLGLSGVSARVFGAVGTVMGSLLGLDDLIAWVRRRRARAV